MHKTNKMHNYANMHNLNKMHFRFFAENLPRNVPKIVHLKRFGPKIDEKIGKKVHLIRKVHLI